MNRPDVDPTFPTIDLPAAADGPEAAVEFLVAVLVRTGRLPGGAAPEVVRRVWQRERLGPTAIGRGVAIPHAQTDLLGSSIGVIGRCPKPFDWPGTLDGEPVRVVCLVATPHGRALAARDLERVARSLRAGRSPGNRQP